MTREQLIILIVVITAILFLILFGLIFFLLKKKKPKKSEIEIDQAYVESIVHHLGEKDNILEIIVDETKLKIKVKDLKKVDLNGLKEMTEGGVFVTSNTIKILFKYESKALKQALEKYKGV